jgi:hypothetical protein
MSCAWRAKKLATGWKGFPSSRNASAARPGEPRNSCKGAPSTTASDEFTVPLFRAEREAHDCEDEAAWWKASRFLKEDRDFSFATSAPKRECRAMWRRDYCSVVSTPALSDRAQKLQRSMLDRLINQSDRTSFRKGVLVQRRISRSSAVTSGEALRSANAR